MESRSASTMTIDRAKPKILIQVIAPWWRSKSSVAAR
jgi:hypothetical protein